MEGGSVLTLMTPTQVGFSSSVTPGKCAPVHSDVRRPLQFLTFISIPLNKHKDKGLRQGGNSAEQGGGSQA